MTLGETGIALAVRHWALNNFPEEKARELFITYPDNATVDYRSQYCQSGYRLPDDLILIFEPPEFNGSNNWVVSGDKTASGLPLLADDPHLGARYAVDLVSDAFEVT